MISREHMLVLAKYLTVGLLGVSVNVGSFSLLLHAGVHYLVASTVAFCFAMVVGFLLQKYWTFKGAAALATHAQFVLYAGVSLFNLLLNDAVVYALVHAGFWPVTAQFAGAAVVAVSSYFIYKHGVFRRHSATHSS